MAYERDGNEKWKDMSLKAIGDYVDAKFKAAQEFYKSKNNGADMSAEDVEDFQARNAELKDARERFATLRETAAAYKANLDFYNDLNETRRPPPHAGNEGAGGGGELKTIGQMFTESRPYVERGSGSNDRFSADLDGITVKSAELAIATGYGEGGAMKATMTSSAGYPVYPPRTDIVIPTAQRPPVVADLIPQDTTQWPQVIYVQEVTFANNAAPTAEGTAKPESALALANVTANVRKIATTLPVTDEQLDDVPTLRAYIDSRLTLMLQLAEDNQLLNGTNTPPDIVGFLQATNTRATTRGASEDNPDAILRAITDVNSITAFANASGIVLNPLQWLAIRLLRTSTGDYIWGHPSQVGPATLWGLPVVSTPVIADGTGLVGDFRMYSHISRRMGIRIEVGYINDDFKLNIKRLRAESRLSLEIYRPSAFNVISNLNKAA